MNGRASAPAAAASSSASAAIPTVAASASQASKKRKEPSESVHKRKTKHYCNCVLLCKGVRTEMHRNTVRFHRQVIDAAKKQKVVHHSAGPSDELDYGGDAYDDDNHSAAGE